MLLTWVCRTETLRKQVRHVEGVTIVASIC
jgi:hypothetical protein